MSAFLRIYIMKRTYPKILKCNGFSLLLAGYVQTGVLFVFPYLAFSPLRRLSIKKTEYTHANAICDSSKLYTNITFTFDINLSLVYTADPKKYWSSSSYTQMTNNVSCFT